MSDVKPYAESSAQNRDPILNVLKRFFTKPGCVLEVGSGTGQHAVYFSGDLPHLIWQPSDVEVNLPGIRAWCDTSTSTNLLDPIALDVRHRPWPIKTADYVYSANTAHIMSWPSVVEFILGVGDALAYEGLFVLYGPFNYEGTYSSKSNERFDTWLRSRDPESGIRDFEAIQVVASRAGLSLVEDVAMPVNNRSLCWKKTKAAPK